MCAYRKTSLLILLIVLSSITSIVGSHLALQQTLDQNNSHLDEFNSKSNLNFNIKTSDTHEPISINGNDEFNQTAFNNGWIGNGSFNNPFIIENYTIYATSEQPGVEIRNTNVSFIIRNISVYDGRSNYNVGFYFNNITNGNITENNATNNAAGFFLKNSYNNSLTDNSAINNLDGFQIRDCYNNTFNGNVAEYSIEFGFYIDNSNNLTLSGNNLSNNTAYSNGNTGFFLKNTENNTLNENVGNFNTKNGFFLSNSSGNTIFNNTANQNSENGFYINISNFNDLTENIGNSNSLNGISLRKSNFSTITHNKVLNNGALCIKEFH
jgi:parallel beta-helix repeat protein